MEFESDNLQFRILQSESSKLIFNPIVSGLLSYTLKTVNCCDSFKNLIPLVIIINGSFVLKKILTREKIQLFKKFNF